LFEVVTPAAAEVVSTADLKAWLRVDTAADDTILGAISAAARDKAEAFTGRRFITQTLRLWLDGWPNGRNEPWWDGVVEGPVTMLDSGRKRQLDLVLAPVQSVSSIKYYATDDTEGTVDRADYIVDVVSSPGRVTLAFAKLWPTTVLRPAKAVAIEMVVGYGAAGSAVPEAIVTAIKEIGSKLYENRGASDCDCEIPGLAKTLLDPYVIKRL
jgi:hypothetical protein